MTIVTPDKGPPRIEGTDVSVIDIYSRYAQDGLEPAEVANELGVGLAQVHEALAYYYRHAEKMREIEAVEK